jgi:hypothetical protein
MRGFTQPTTQCPRPTIHLEISKGMISVHEEMSIVASKAESEVDTRTTLRYQYWALKPSKVVSCEPFSVRS